MKLDAKMKNTLPETRRKRKRSPYGVDVKLEHQSSRELITKRDMLQKPHNISKDHRISLSGASITQIGTRKRRETQERHSVKKIPSQIREKSKKGKHFDPERRNRRRLSRITGRRTSRRKAKKSSNRKGKKHPKSSQAKPTKVVQSSMVKIGGAPWAYERNSDEEEVKKPNESSKKLKKSNTLQTQHGEERSPSNQTRTLPVAVKPGKEEDSGQFHKEQKKASVLDNNSEERKEEAAPEEIYEEVVGEDKKSMESAVREQPALSSGEKNKTKLLKDQSKKNSTAYQDRSGTVIPDAREASKKTKPEDASEYPERENPEVVSIGSNKASYGQNNKKNKPVEKSDGKQHGKSSGSSQKDSLENMNYGEAPWSYAKEI